MKFAESYNSFDIAVRGDREIVISRAFDAPRELVFNSFTVPDLVKQWLLGPDGWTMPVCQIDLRKGGNFEYRWSSSDGGMEVNVTGTFREIRRPSRIVHTERMEGQPGEALVTTEFTENNGSTFFTMTLQYQSREIRDMAIGTGMAKGVERSYQRLADVLFTGSHP